jgi:hypothetical protein
MPHLDHVVLAVADLDAAATRLYDERGLASAEGGAHEGFGTANRIVPLGDTYVELMGVVEHDIASAHPFGRQLLSFVENGDRLMTWAVQTDDIVLTAKRVGGSVVPMTRRRPDGVLLSWRVVGVEGAMVDRSLPFFIQWDGPPDDHPGRMRADHRTTVNGITELVVAGSAPTIKQRLHDADVPLRVVTGEPGPVSVTISTSDGDVVLA